MKLTFLGATHEVTGSCTYLSACGKHMLIDYGMEQGRDTFENEPLPVLPSEIDYVFLTHAHIDHSGLLPLLYKNGFAGQVHATIPTKNLCDIMLQDSAHIQESEAQWKSRKSQRRGQKPVEPLYSMEDAMGILSLFVGHRYEEKATVCDGVQVRFTDAGHLLGSSSITLWITEEGETRRIVFSGDIGNINQPLIRDPQFLREADYVVMESTYGDREHNPPPDYTAALAEVLQRTLDRGGNVVIPSFAVGRTQELLYFIRHIKEKGLVHGHEGFQVYVDSPLAINATKIFVDNAEFCYDEEAAALLREGINPIAFPGLVTASTSQESIAINADPTPKVIISASGMCEAGRIRHHLKHNLWRPESTILFVGYQAVGTLGRLLVDGLKKVKLFNEDIEVNAQIDALPGVSGHADKDGLIDWLRGFEEKPKLVFVNHGDPDAADSFTACLNNELGYKAFAPYSGTSFDLLSGEFVAVTKGIPVEKKPAGGRTVSAAFTRLVAAAERLLRLVRGCEGRPNKELARYADQIEAIANKIEK